MSGQKSAPAPHIHQKQYGLVDIERYISLLIDLLRNEFSSRLLYVGLQGSYLRGEATESSDIDIMIIIDRLEIADLDAYRDIIQSIPYYDKSCGFICGKEDIIKWNPLEICHLLHSTKDYYGALSVYVPKYTEQDIRNFIKMSVNNLYHEICHRYIHADTAQNISALPRTYKGCFFILQNLHYLNQGVFAQTKASLLEQLQGINRAVLQRALEMQDSSVFDFHNSIELLFTWCREVMQSL